MAAQQQKENYQRVLDQTIEQLTKEGKVPTLLLHSCCAPCSSYVLEYLSKYFKITLLYYNPNISPKEEYEARVREQKRLIGGNGLCSSGTVHGRKISAGGVLQGSKRP